MKDWNFCPRCASSLRHEEDPVNPSVHCPNCGFAKWNNPLPTTIGVILDGTKALLVRRKVAPRKGTWDAVGGFLAGSESAEECLLREAREELGLDIHIIGPLGTYPSIYGDTGLSTIGVAFECELIISGDINLSDENDAFGWFELEQLPEIAFADVAASLSEAAARARVSE